MPTRLKKYGGLVMSNTIFMIGCVVIAYSLAQKPVVMDSMGALIALAFFTDMVSFITRK
jgi:hypothetical protein